MTLMFILFFWDLFVKGLSSPDDDDDALTALSLTVFIVESRGLSLKQMLIELGLTRFYDLFNDYVLCNQVQAAVVNDWQI